MASDTDSDFELIDSLEVAKQIVAHKKPNIPKIREWLKPTDYNASSSEFQRHLTARASGTGEWIRETSQFGQWFDSEDHGSIWIKAVPGAGKSVVAASMVHSLAATDSVPVLYFFFRQIIETNRSCRSLLQDWLSQLLPFSEIVQVSLWDLLEAKEQLENLSNKQLWKHLLAGLRAVDRAYCIVDALDEMTIDDEFLSQVNDLGSFKPAHIKVLLTSRPKQYLQRALRDPQVIHVSLEEELVKQDISVFVQQRVNDLDRLRPLDEKTRNFIQDTVCQRSEGLFLYARLMLDQLLKSATSDIGTAPLREIVSKLPVGLEEMYNRILFHHSALTNTSQDIQVIILQMVTHSARPMRLIELARALETDQEVSKTKESKEVIRSACGPLLEVMEDEVVQILHHSFTEFLMDDSRTQRVTTESPQFPIIKSLKSHHDIALTCLACLKSDVTRIHTVGDQSDQAGRKRALSSHFLQYPFLEYAAKEWTYHARNYNAKDESFFDKMMMFCEPESPHFAAWLEFRCGGTDSAVSSQDSTPLHIAAGFGLISWAKHLIEMKLDVDALDSTQNSPLFWASKHNYVEAVDILIKAGAKPDIDGYNGLKPLHTAASRNHAGVVKLLLAAGVPPNTPKPREVGRMCGNAPSSVGSHPLMFASQRGHLETIREMIPFAEQLDLEDSLALAAKGGHSHVVAMLLDASVSPESFSKTRSAGAGRRSGGENALSCAVQSADLECVRLLVDKGANVCTDLSATPNLPEDKIQSRLASMHGMKPISMKTMGHGPLHTFAQVSTKIERETSMKAILDLLVSRGADVNAKDSNGVTPLMLACGIGKYRTSNSVQPYKLLLAVGADACSIANNGDTALHRSCQYREYSVSKNLLENGASAKLARLSDGKTPLHCAAIANYHAGPGEHIQLLADYGADANARDAEGRTALYLACTHYMSSKSGAIDALLKIGADVNIQDNLGRTCLHTYQDVREDERYREIVLAGGNLEICDHLGATVLLHAILENQKIIDILLSLPDKPSMSARIHNKGKTVLHLACRSRQNGALGLVQKLVSHGADLNWTDDQGNTLLHEAARWFKGATDYVPLIEYLVKSGVPINARNWRGQIPAHITSIYPRMFTTENTSVNAPIRESFVSVLSKFDVDIDVNTQDRDGYTPLHYAAAASELQALRLIQAGARLNAKAFNLRTPLHCAARGRRSSIIAMLLRSGKELDQAIEVDALDVDGRSALHDASRSGRPESVSLLIDAGADVHLMDKALITPLMACEEFSEEEAIWNAIESKEDFLDDSDVDDPFRIAPTIQKPKFRKRLGEVPHMDAVRQGIIVQKLIAAGAEDHRSQNLEKSDRNESILEALTIKKHDGTVMVNPMSIPKMGEAEVDYLLHWGVDLVRSNLPNERMTTIAMFANLGMVELMRKVLTSAKLFDDPEFYTSIIVDDNSASRNRVPPLLQVACNRPMWNMDMIKLLVEEGQVDLNAHTIMLEYKGYSSTGNYVPGATALHVLALGHFWWQADAIKYLVERGANINALDDCGNTSLDVACKPVTYGSYQRAGIFRPQCCEMLLRSGADPNRVDANGLTALNKAGSDVEIIQTLLRYGADIGCGEKNVLISAVEAGDVNALRLYLENGADCNIPDTSIRSGSDSTGSQNFKYRYALAAAAFPSMYSKWNPSASSDMAALLLKHGAKVNLPIDDDQTMLHYLLEHAREPVIRRIVERRELDLNIRDQEGRSAFMAACSNNPRPGFEAFMGSKTKEEIATFQAEHTPAYLLLANAPFHGKSIDYLAVDNKGNHMIFYLMGRWKDCSARFLAVPGVKELIRKKNNASFSPLHIALKLRNVELCMQLMEDGQADLVEADPNGDTAFHHLCRTNNVRDFQSYVPLIMKYMALGGSMNASNNRGETALLVCLASFSPPWHVEEREVTDNLPFFLNNGANFQAVRKDGATALHIVAQRRVQDMTHTRNRGDCPDYNAEMFQKLVELGCDPLQEDNEGRTALDIAAASGNSAILKLYQRKKA